MRMRMRGMATVGKNREGGNQSRSVGMTRVCSSSTVRGARSSLQVWFHGATFLFNFCL